ncbi:PREDICTED: uncharacterized protein LOC109470487 [Branchiostoma belcheri]|uniref:Uncharacterized protein LOC109470487 n=1 Tax=Branchiostoma belcheri TaxID=7741 RepID=A0A6P4Z5Y1_BRABE|nr:PREDICTED: uncharacterized protein LOC109470487 [Branchiostoma belcheri]
MPSTLHPLDIPNSEKGCRTQKAVGKVSEQDRQTGRQSLAGKLVDHLGLWTQTLEEDCRWWHRWTILGCGLRLWREGCRWWHRWTILGCGLRLWREDCRWWHRWTILGCGLRLWRVDCRVDCRVISTCMNKGERASQEKNPHRQQSIK